MIDAPEQIGVNQSPRVCGNSRGDRRGWFKL